MITAHWTGFKNTINKAENLGLNYKDAVTRASRQTVDKIVNDAMQILNDKRMQEHHMHGWMVRHIKDTWDRNNGIWHGDSFTIKLINTSDHAAAVEFGVKHRIYPKSKKPGALLWLGDSIFKASVRGQPPKHFLQGAINKHSELLNAFKKYLRDEINLLI